MGWKSFIGFLFLIVCISSVSAQEIGTLKVTKDPQIDSLIAKRLTLSKDNRYFQVWSANRLMQSIQNLKYAFQHTKFILVMYSQITGLELVISELGSKLKNL
jgi:hypothetical protein